MKKEDNIIRFYFLAASLKNKIRSGWKEINITSERLESVAEHIFGTLILAVTLDSEYELNVDIYKVLKMLILHELEEIIIPDYTINSGVSKEQKLEEGRRAVHKVTEGLVDQVEIESLLEEFNAHITPESKFAFQIDKMECDLQSKKYDLEGYMNFENVKKDALKFGNEEICNNAVKPSDIWLEVDRQLYEDELFITLLNALKNYK